MCWGSLVPRPSAQLSLTYNVGEGLVFLSHVSDVMMEKIVERVLIVCGQKVAQNSMKSKGPR